VPGVAAVHHPLRHIKTGPGKVGLTVHIDHPADRAAMHSHSKLQASMLFKRAADFERAFHGLFLAFIKNQRHPVAGRDLNQSPGCFGVLKLLGRASGLSQFSNRRALIVNRKLRIANDVDKENVSDFRPNVFLNFSGHFVTRPEGDTMNNPVSTPTPIIKRNRQLLLLTNPASGSEDFHFLFKFADSFPI